MSKSYGNYIALTDEPNDMYGKLMSIGDDLIVEYFTLLTDVALTEIDEMAAAIENGANPMEFKKKLAFEITRFYHDESSATAAAEHFAKTVQNKEVPTDIEKVNITGAKVRVLDLLKACLPDETNGNLKRLVEQGAVELLPAGEKPSDFTAELTVKELDIVRIGKRRYFKIAHE
jgi:tyrosyl-tRNA synthetase